MTRAVHCPLMNRHTICNISELNNGRGFEQNAVLSLRKSLDAISMAWVGKGNHLLICVNRSLNHAGIRTKTMCYIDAHAITSVALATI